MARHDLYQPFSLAASERPHRCHNLHLVAVVHIAAVLAIRLGTLLRQVGTLQRDSVHTESQPVVAYAPYQDHMDQPLS